MSTPEQSLDDRMDRLVAEYSDRVSAGQPELRQDLIVQVPEEHRATLERCFRMIRAGLATAPSAAQPIGPGSVLDGYKIVREIGRGGMAVVYEAVQEELQRLVALKVLRTGLALDAKNVDRFRREALAVARLQHPHIVQVFAVGEALGHHYIAMELVTGTTLAEIYAALPDKKEWSPDDLAQAAGIPALAEGHESYERALCALLAPVVRALGLAHELGMVHRDVKPSNILVHGDGRAVLADFGLAKGDGDPALSLTGEPLGTPYYMSPEQAAVIREPVDNRSDVYSAGVTIYEGLTGKRPFEGDNVYEVLDAIRSGYPLSPRGSRRSLSRSVDAVVRKAMARLPEQRYPTALDLSTDLSALAEGRLTTAAVQAGGFRNRVSGGVVEGLRIFASGGSSRGEYRSEASFLGMPIVHVNFGPRVPGQPLRRARGWFAAGELALGFIAFGPFAAGVFAWGAFALGAVTWAGIGMGLVSFAGLSMGVLATGGLAIGVGAIGGLAIGLYSSGGAALGRYSVNDPETAEVVTEFMSRWMPWGP